MKTFLVLFLFPLSVWAQTDTLGPNDLRDRAFQMTKATVEFLATDTKLYGYPDQTTCPDCVSYPSLRSFIKEQKLTKADGLVNDTERWVNDPTTAAKAPATALAELRTQLIDRITEGRERQHRRQLPTFAAYEAKMTQLASGAAPVSLALNAGQQRTDAEPEDAQPQTDTEVAPTDETAPVTTTPVANSEGWFSKSGLALLLSLLSLGLVGWLLATRRKPEGTGKTVDANTDGQIAKLSDEVFRLKGDRNNAQDANLKLLKRVEQLENQVTVLQKAVGGAATALQPTMANPPADGQPTPNPTPVQRQQTQTGPAPSTVPPPAPTRPNPTQPQPTPTAPPENRPRGPVPEPVPPSAQPPVAGPAPVVPPSQPKVLYARTVDLGDGFSTDSLSETTSERPMVYQIQVQAPGQATFRVADDPYAQRLALSDPYSYLNDACEYTSQPAPNSRIQTTKPGRLVLQGSKWVIQEKAQIAFS